jgi:probable F420-dependent oxidoreductase
MSRGLTFASLASLGLPASSGIGELALRSGYDSLWVAETTGTEAFASLAQLGGAHPGVTLGTGVLALQLRTPLVAAMGAATLAAAGHRVELGVGISSPVVVGRWHGETYGDRPLAQTREFLTVLRAALSGETVRFEGEFHRVNGFRLGVRFDAALRPRIVLGALNAQMLHLAGELADGVLLNYLPASAVPWCVEQVRAGEARAGRSVGSCRVHAYVHVGVGDPVATRTAAQKDLFSYSVVPAYAKAFERAGFGAAVAACRAAHAAGDRAGAVAAISDEMCAAINIVGDAHHVARAVTAYESAGVDHVVIMPLPWGDDRRAATVATLHAAAPEVL